MNMGIRMHFSRSRLDWDVLEDKNSSSVLLASRLQSWANYWTTSVSPTGWHKETQMGTRISISHHFLDRLASCIERPSPASKEKLCAGRGVCVSYVPPSQTPLRRCSCDYHSLFCRVSPSDGSLPSALKPSLTLIKSSTSILWHLQ